VCHCLGHLLGSLLQRLQRIQSSVKKHSVIALVQDGSAMFAPFVLCRPGLLLLLLLFVVLAAVSNPTTFVQRLSCQSSTCHGISWLVCVAHRRGGNFELYVASACSRGTVGCASVDSIAAAGVCCSALMFTVVSQRWQYCH
jgi:hypothetical protein